MLEQPPKFPDNPNHANGTCEECGEPCQVYGCRWCPGCYESASAVVRDALRPFKGRALTPDLVKDIKAALVEPAPYPPIHVTRDGDRMIVEFN